MLEGVPLITEFMADNTETLYSESFNDYFDWIEIYNPGPGSVDLFNWFLSDRDELHYWKFPQICVLQEDEFFVVFASLENTITPEGEWHTNFALALERGSLALVRPDGTSIVSEYDPYPLQTPDVSYGLTTTFDDEAYFTTPTPGEMNTPSFRESVFSPEHGFYVEPFQVALDTTVLDEPVYYTTDGTVPTPADEPYIGAITLDRTTTLRAKAFGPGAEPRVYTQTYIFLDDVLQQPAAPDGFPTDWEAADGSSVPADYEVDPEVVTDPAYSGSLTEDLLAIPAFSIVMDGDDLFSPATGIYANPLLRGELWERATSVELIFPDGSEGFREDAGIRIRGGNSRDPAKTPKHSFRVTFSGDYGPSKLEFPLFAGSRMDQFDNLVLRGSYQDTWLNPDPCCRPDTTMIRDRWVRETHLAMGRPAVRGRYVHLYLNGQYWGVYELSERIDDAFASSYFGGEDADYDVVDTGQLADGNLDAWNSMIDLAAGGVATDQAYQDIQQYLDVPNFIDFMILNIFAGRVDLSEGNWYALSNRDRGDPFRFYSWDAEETLRAVDEDQSEVTGTNSPAFLYSRLRENAEFRRQFGDQVNRHFANGGALTLQATAGRWSQIADQLSSAVVAESARWGDYRRDVHQFAGGPYELYTRDDHWLGAIQRLPDDYFPQRSGIVLDQFYVTGLYPAVEAPAFSQHGGLIEPDSTLTITAPEGEIYYTIDGSDPWLFGTGVNPGASLYVNPVSLTQDMIVKARVLHDGQWSAANEAGFFEPMPLQVTEIMYNSRPADDPYTGGDFDFVELMNVGPDPLDLTGVEFTDGIWFAFDDSPVDNLAPGQRVVLVGNMAAFPTRYDTAGILIAGEFSGRLNNAGEQIALVGWLGQSILDFVVEDSWYPITDGDGYSLVTREIGEISTDWSDSELWRPSSYSDGSPGTWVPGYDPGSVIINETLTHNDGPPGDWIELYNTTDGDIDIGGWYLSDSKQVLTRYRIADDTLLPAGGYLVFSADEHFGRAGLPGVNIPFKINKLGDRLLLTSAAPDGSLGGYRELVSFGYGFNPVTFIRYTNSMGEVEFVPSSQNTKGAPNAAPLVGMTYDHGNTFYSPVISEVMYDPAGDGDEYVELYNPHDEPAQLFGPFNNEDTWRFTRGISYSFPPGVTIPPDRYALIVGIDPNQFRAKYNVPAQTQIFGPYVGELLDTEDRVVLSRPVPRTPEFVPYSMADQVHYNGPGDWPLEADGQDASLERRCFSHYGNEVLNWTVGPTGGTPGRPDTIAEASAVAVVRNGQTGMPSDPNGEADVLPESLEWIDEWDTFWVEIWLVTPNSVDLGICGASVDMTYNTDYFTAVTIEFGPAFVDNYSGSIDDDAGMVTHVGATTPLTDAGDDRFVFFARVMLTPFGSDQTPIDLMADQPLGPYNLGLGLTSVDVELAGLGPTLTDAGPPSETELWSVVYDYDDSNKIDLGDLASFAGVFLQPVDEIIAPDTWWADFNKDGFVDIGDLAEMAPNFLHQRSGNAIEFPANFPDAWRPQKVAAGSLPVPSHVAAVLTERQTNGSAETAVATADTDQTTVASLSARKNQTDSLARLALRKVSGDVFDQPMTGHESVVEELAWLHELERISKQQEPDEKHRRAEEAVDMLLATF